MSKAGNLKIAAGGGFKVPLFDVVDISGILNVTLAIDEVLQGCIAHNAKEVSDRIEGIIRSAPFSKPALKIDPSKKYAVRSSGEGEDSDKYSFAGQYESYLNAQGAAEIEKRIIDCYISQYSEKSILYRLNNGLSLQGLSMSVMVQEMIEPDISGVAFSVNVLTGSDTQIMYEAAGNSKNATSGKNGVSAYVYDWYNDKEIKADESGLKLGSGLKEEITSAVLKLQCLFGYPVDVEFAFENNILYILQVRPITKIVFADLREQFTSANFRDGGVAAQACIPLLWSLYEFAWDNSLKDFFVKTKAFKPKDLTMQIRLYFARPYWNVSSCKEACLKLPGFVERDYDTDLGLRIDYAGSGRRTRITPRFLMRLTGVLKGTFKVLKENERDLEKNKQTLLAGYYRFASVDLDTLSVEELQALYKEFITLYYFKSEYNYFWQAFVNIVRLSIYRRSVLKTVTRSEYFDLLSDLKDVSHLRPYARAGEYAETIKADAAALAFWQDTSAGKIAEQYRKNPDGYKLDLITKFNEEFGYHSFKELDLTYPDFHENPVYAVRLIQDNVKAPAAPGQGGAFEKRCEALKRRLTQRQYKTVIKQTGTIRKFLWWREEFKDISTRYYSLVRKFTLCLAARYADKGFIEKAEDIFFLKFTDIIAFTGGEASVNDLKKLISKNRVYFESFLNFENQNEIGGTHGHPVFKSAAKAALKGVGCGGGTAKGPARIIERPEDLDSVKKGDIIIARHFDAGYTGKFKIIAGIITETGGVLCHSSIIAREYNLPAIVSSKGITQKIKTGDIIGMDADTGSIAAIELR